LEEHTRPQRWVALAVCPEGKGKVKIYWSTVSENTVHFVFLCDH